MPICFIIISAASILNILGAVLNVSIWLTLFVIDLVLYLCVPFMCIMMSLICVFTLLESPEVALLVCQLFFFNSHFWKNFIFGITVKFSLLIGKKMILFLLSSLVGVPLGMPT